MPTSVITPGTDPAAAPPPRHLTTLEHTGPFARASCSCGWRGPGRRALSKARDDGAQHEAGALR